MKKNIALLLTALMALSMLAGCAQEPAAAPAEESADVPMQYITAEELSEVLGSEGYTVMDVRVAADFEEASIPGAVSVDMDAAKNGDAEAGKAAMTAATQGLSDTLVLVCYSGKSYAQASTNALSAVGYDMSKVYTLEGGFNNWKEVYPDLVSAGGAPIENAEPAAEAEVQSGDVTFDVDMSQYEKGKTVRLWLPVPQSDDYQSIENVAFDAGDAKAEINTDAQGNQMLYVEWGADAEPESRKASLSFHAARQEILRPELIEEGEAPAELSQYLAACSMIPVDGAVKEQADEITANETTVLGKARAIYDWIIANMNRDNSVIGCGTGDVCTLLDTKAGKCTDINSVFVGLCRAAGIPAREMFGVRINAEDITKNQHCWAEFYLPGTGWVTADPADVLKAVLTNEWDKESDETKELQEYYWGGCDKTRIELSAGRDLVLAPAQDGEPLNNFGYPYAEVDGEAVDYYTPDAFVYTISFAQDN